MKNLAIGALITMGILSCYSCDGKSRKQEETQSTQLLINAEHSGENISAMTRKIKFLRQGGGNIEYTLSLEDDSIKVHVTQKQFKETDYKFSFAKTEVDSATVNALQKIINKETDLGVLDTTKSPGNFMCGGTWSFAYVVEDTTVSEIYNKELVGNIGQTEDWVRAAIDTFENKKSEE